MSENFLDQLFRSNGGGGGAAQGQMPPKTRKRPRDAQNEESFTDAELQGGGGGGMGFGNVDMFTAVPPPIADVIEWKYVMLEKDRIEEERIQEQYETEGIGRPTYKCEICRVGDMSENTTGNVSSTLQRLYELARRSYHRVPDAERFASVARKFNETIWTRNERLGKRKVDLKKWTGPMVQHHYTVCDTSSPEQQIDRDIEILNDNIEFIRKRGLYRQKTVNGEERDMEMDKANHDKMLNAMRVKAVLIKEADRIRNGGSLVGSGRKRGGNTTIENVVQVGLGGGGGDGGRNGGASNSKGAEPF